MVYVSFKADVGIYINAFKDNCIVVERLEYTSDEIRVSLCFAF